MEPTVFTKQDLQIALGAAVAANCVSCFEHLFEKAKEIGLETEEILRVVQIATKVKNGAHVFLKASIDDILGTKTTEPQDGCSGPLNAKACSC